MRNILLTACMLLGALAGQAQCSNGDFSAGSFTGWTPYISTASSTGTINPSAYASGTSASRHIITNSGYVDPVLGSSVMPGVCFGPYAARLGNNVTGAQSEILSYTFTLTQDFSFMYALVFQDVHADTMVNPFFCYWLSTTSDLATSTTGPNLLAMNYYRADNTSFYQDTVVSGTAIVYKQWTKECVMQKFPSLYARVGQPVTIYFATADCSAGGHFGYAYIDELCRPNNASASFTTPSTFAYVGGAINVNATASLYENQYYYTAVRCDASGTAMGTPVSTAVHEGMAGIADIRPWFPAGFFTPTPTTAYFKITLYVRNCNGYWAPYSRVVQMLY